MPNNSSRLISLMFIIGRRMKDDIRQYAKKSDCSLLHFEALRYVQDNGKPLMRDVANYFSITPPAATLLVDGLVANKLLQRIVDPHDRRAVRVSITLKGKQMIERGIQDRVKKMKKIFSVLNQKERAELTRILEKIAKP